MKKRDRLWLFCASALFAIVSLAIPCSGDTWNVPTPVPTIQAAVDSAASGDSILVAAGSYTGDGFRDISVSGKHVIIIATGGSVNIDCEGWENENHSAINYYNTGDGFNLLSGFIITGVYPGPGTYCSNARLNIDNCSYTGNSLWGHFCVCIEGTSRVIMENSSITGNENGCSDTSGPGIYSSAYLELRNCLISGNSGDSGSAIRVAGDTCVITDSHIQNNDSYYEAIRIQSSPYTYISNTTIYENKGILIGESEVFIYNSLLRANGGRMLGYGPAIELYNATLNLESVTHTGNRYLWLSESSVSATKSVFHGTPIGEMGTWIYIATGSAELSCCDVYGNEGGDWVNGIAGQDSLPHNFSADPLFCDAGAGIFTLHSASPCLPGNHPNGCDCGLIGAEGLGCPDGAPYISSLGDVLNDQGRQVSISWYRSSCDSMGSAQPVLSYEVYRRIDDLPVVAGVSEPTPATGRGADAALAYPPGDWHYLFDVPAHGEDVYHVVAPTLEDSCVYNDSTVTGEPLYYSTFFIRASTAVPTTYFDSGVDSGYSVDNLSPASPAGLMMTDGTLLQWNDNEEPDFAHYRVYAKEHLDTTSYYLADITLLSEFDVAASIAEGYHHWGVTSCDYNGNESAASEIAWLPTGNDPETPRAYALEQNYPNPFNPTTTIRFVIPERTAVRVAVYDVEGRLVAVLLDKEMDRGAASVVWNGMDTEGRKAASGVYFYRLETPRFTESRKMLLLR
ncbi:MAG TPA: T9SS type A sorting domain-containing protein [Patescibacteria group bacterium]|nr:T9SS type A sorting domain-containing protein [Patescibacteria group bacterium]